MRSAWGRFWRRYRNAPNNPKKSAQIGAACIIELTFLNAREKLGIPFGALMAYDD